jgi:SAM-dependent methyltransferase
MLRATDLAHLLVRQVVKPGDWVIDATAGNGHDTAFLASLVGEHGRVFGFDVQANALAATRARLGGVASVDLIHAGHETIIANMPFDARGRIAAVMFNLGYLPGADKHVITGPTTSCMGLQGALDLLAPQGLVTVVLYRGHVGGPEEAEAVLALAKALPSTFVVVHSARLNAEKPAPELLAIQRRGA